MIHDTDAVLSRRSRRFVLALGLNSALVVGEFIASFVAHSVALGADAGHNLVDVGGLVLALGAMRLSRRPPTARRSFGYARTTILAGFTNLVVVLAVTVVIVLEAIERIIHHSSADGPIIAGVGAISVVFNLGAALMLHESDADLNVRTAVWHLAGDAVSSLAVFVAGLVIALSHHWSDLDPIASLVVAVIIAISGLRLWNEYTQILLEAAPTDVDLGALATSVASIGGVAGVHDLHCWSLSSDIRALSAHVVLDDNPSLVEAQALSEQIKQLVYADFHIAHATLELESTACVPETPCGIESDTTTGNH